MPEYNHKLVDDIIAVLDVKQLRKFPQQTKIDFTQKVIRNVARIQKLVDHFPAFRKYIHDSKEVTVHALIAFEGHKNFFSQPPEDHDIAIYNATLYLEKDHLILDEARKVLERMSSTIDDRKKPGQDNTKAFLVAKAVVRVYEEVFHLKPTHNRAFQTYAYDPESWDVAEKGNPTVLDKVWFVISRHTDISFSESTLREAISLRQRAVRLYDKKEDE